MQLHYSNRNSSVAYVTFHHFSVTKAVHVETKTTWAQGHYLVRAYFSFAIRTTTGATGAATAGFFVVAQLSIFEIIELIQRGLILLK